ncbi:MAG: nitroreductase family protein [bacterium]
MDIIRALNRRYATKKFDAKRKLTAKQMTTIKEILRLTPTSLGLQWMKFVIIKNKKTRQELFAYSKQQPQILDCSHLVVFTVPTKINDKMIDNFLALIKETRGTDNIALQDRKKRIKALLQRYKDNNEIDGRLKQQANIALGNLLTACAVLKIDTCPLGAIQPDMYDKILGLQKE